MQQRSFCEFQIKLLKQNALWPLENESRHVAVLHRLFFCIQMVSLLLVSMALFAEAVFSRDLKNVSNSIDMVTLTASAFYKAYFITFNGAQFQKLIDSTNSIFKTVYNQNGGKFCVKYESRRCSLYTVALCFSGFIYISFFVLAPILESATEAATMNMTLAEKLSEIYPRYPLKIWLPFDTYWTPMYQFIYFIQCFALFASTYIYLTMDSFFFMLIYQVCLQMKILAKMVQSLAEENANLRSRTSKNRREVPSSEKKSLAVIDEPKKMEYLSMKNVFTKNNTRVEFEKCIKFHSDLLRITEEIESLYVSIILADIIHATISLSFAFYATDTSETIYERLTMFIFLLICIVHQFCNSFYGQQLLDAQELISKALCNLPWYAFDIQTRKILVLVLARSNKQVVLNGGKMYHLRFESFVMFLKAIFSYYMVLRRMSL